MKSFCLAGLMSILVMLAAAPVPALSAEQAVITSPFTKIYSALDPDSSIIRMASKNERFELDHAGQKWFRVRLEDGRVGFIPARDAKVENVRASSSVRGILAFLAIVVVAVSAFFGLRGRQRRQAEV